MQLSAHLPRLLQLWFVVVFAFVSGAEPAEAGRVEGRVVDSRTGEPLRQVRVSAPGTTSMSFTSADGHFTLDGLWPAIFTIEVGPWSSSGDIFTSQIKVSDGVTVLEPVRLAEPRLTSAHSQLRAKSDRDHGARVVGRIVESGNGEPLTGARVSIVGDALKFKNGRLRLERFEASTYAEGIFSVLRVPAGTYSVRARHWTHDSVEIKGVVIGDDDDVALELEMTPQAGLQVGSIEGRVVDARCGQPASFASVQIEGSPVYVQTRRDGGFQIGDVPVGPQVLRVRATRLLDAWRDTVVVRAGETTQVAASVASNWSPVPMDEVGSAAATCKVHEERMFATILPISYGCGGGPPREYLEARESFPNAEPYWGRGGPITRVGSSKTPRKVLAWICDVCVIGRNAFVTDGGNPGPTPRATWPRHAVGGIFSLALPPDMDVEQTASRCSASGDGVGSSVRMKFEVAGVVARIHAFRDPRYIRYNERLGSAYAELITNVEPMEIGGYAHVVTLRIPFATQHDDPLHIAIYAKDEASKLTAIKILRSVELTQTRLVTNEP